MGFPLNMCPDPGQSLWAWRCLAVIFPDSVLCPAHCHWVGLQVDTHKNLLTGVLGSPVAQLLVDPHNNAIFSLIDQRRRDGSVVKSTYSLIEDQSLVLSNHIRWPVPPVASAPRGSDISDLPGYLHSHAHTHTQTPTHTIKTF